MKEYIDFSEWFNLPNLKAGISLRQMAGDNHTIRLKLMEHFQLSSIHFCTANQTHSDKILFVHKQGSGMDCDGFITQNKSLVLFINVADCIPIYLVDEHSGLTGLVHSGWRGTVHQISINAVKLMSQFGGNPNHIKALLGPGICQKHFEVKEDIVSYFPKHLVKSNGNQSFFVDLKHMIKDQLILSGIFENSIYDCELCTYCRNDLFFSFRKEKKLNGRMFAVMGWTGGVS